MLSRSMVQRFACKGPCLSHLYSRNGISRKAVSCRNLWSQGIPPTILLYWPSVRVMLQRFLARIYDWLAPCDATAPGDLIFTLAGRQTRNHFALQLYSQGLAPVLLLSVGRYEIRRFAQLPLPMPLDLTAVAAPVPARQRHFFVAVESGKITATPTRRGYLGTLSEMLALAAWLKSRPKINSVLIISSAFHLRRVRACARSVLSPTLKIRYLAVPRDGCFTGADWWRSRSTRGVVLREFPKLVVYRVALMCKSLQSETAGPTAS